MRLGVISDIHGNARALEAAVGRLRRRGVDRWVCPGDLVGYGPLPNEAVQMVRELGAECVAGNHDLVCTGQLDEARTGEWALRTLRWTREVLEPQAFDFLAALPARAEIGGAVVTHGSLDDPEEYLDSPARAHAELERLERGHPPARFLLAGHTHRSVAFSARRGRVLGGRAGSVELRDERWLLNPGSVGQPRAWRTGARAMILDLEAATAELVVAPYDVRACRRELRERGLPVEGCHLRPTPRETAGRAWRRLTAAEL